MKKFLYMATFYTRHEFLAYTLHVAKSPSSISLGSNIKNLLTPINFLFKGSKHLAKYISLLSPICKSNSKLRQLKSKLKNREKYKISPCGLLDLQFTPCGIKTNSKVPVVCKKNNLILTVKFHPLT
jgi:hypothetical protein